MDPAQIMEWLEDDDEIIGSISTTIALLIKRQNKRPKRGGSQFGWQEIHQNRLQGHVQLFNDYFSDNPTYPKRYFRRRFRMRRELFLKIVDAIVQQDVYFVQKRVAAGQLGFSPLKKVTAALRLLAYGYGGDSIDEYLRMSKYFFSFNLLYLANLIKFRREYCPRITKAVLLCQGLHIRGGILAKPPSR